MADRVVQPSVFVVDGEASGCPSVPSGRWRRRRRGRCSPTQLLLAILVLLALLGVALEAYFLKRFQEELQGTASQISKGINSSAAKMIQEQTLKVEKPAAHVTGAIGTQSASGEAVLQWEHALGLAFLHQVDYRDGHLQCTKPGHYFVYSKIQLGELRCESPNYREASMFTHGIYKKTPKYPEEMALMVSNKPYCGRRDVDQWLDSSFLAGVFFLEELDEVYVRVPNKQLVRVKDGTRSYFGMFMI
ncbi:tumor necrosis factor ligand superfamily member 14 [Rhinatrema bivittatum]|uniref:tumor necrosis factor ligand superfamily member 14 n=1 Tax=Rhinatrema bivittatum TaxID=194408 RepID=UPI00112E9771|nr:tumor necrosis factor ligand superfamily member 14 [Rhinatrema bivittatum]